MTTTELTTLRTVGMTREDLPFIGGDVVQLWHLVDGQEWAIESVAYCHFFYDDNGRDSALVEMVAWLPDELGVPLSGDRRVIPLDSITSVGMVWKDADVWKADDFDSVMLKRDAEGERAAKVADSAEKLKIGRDAKRQVLVEDGAFGLFEADGIVSITDLQLRPDIPDLVKGVLPAASLTMLFGESYSGKTFVALDWSLSIATGTPWQGHAVTKAKVLYLAMEGVQTLKPRVEAWSAAHGITPTGFDVYPQVVNFFDDDSVALLRRQVAAGGYGLVVIDTLSRSYGGANENDAEPMGGYIAALSNLREATPNTSVLVLHHAKKDSPNEYRGSTVLFAGLDSVIAMTMARADAPERKLVFQKMKSGELPSPIGLAFEPSARSAVLVPYGPREQIGVEVAAFESLDGPVTRKRLQDALVDSGAIETEGTARNRVGRLISNGVFAEVVNPDGGKMLVRPNATGELI